jgi:hypothetical protein
MAVGIHDFSTRFSNEKIWKRQRPSIEIIKNPEKKKAAYERLRIALSNSEAMTDVPESEREKRCKTELIFNKSLKTGNYKDAENKLEVENFDPYSACNTESMIINEAKARHNIAGMIAFFAGVVGFVASFFKKKD